jgi:hypothetical protein
MKVDEDQPLNRDDAPDLPPIKSNQETGSISFQWAHGTSSRADQGNSPTQHRCHSVIRERRGWFYYVEQNAGRSSRCRSMIATAMLRSSWSRSRTSLAILLTCIQTKRREWSDPGAPRWANSGLAHVPVWAKSCRGRETLGRPRSSLPTSLAAPAPPRFAGRHAGL